MIDLAGKAAVITGGAGGIGRAIATRMQDCGAKVAVLDIHPSEQASSDEPDGIHYLKADVTDLDSMRRAVDGARERLGGIDVAVASAGIASVATAPATSEDEWNRVLAVNLTGVWTLAAAVIPEMQSRGSGSITNIASASALVGMRAVAAYSAAKAGVIGLTRQMAADFARKGIRVNAVCPGSTRTPLLDELYERVEQASASRVSAQERIAADTRSYPLGRLGEPADIASAVTFLASDDAAWITGAILPVDGGYTAI